MGSGTDHADQAEHATDPQTSDRITPEQVGREQMERVEGLLASVQDLVASLQRAGTELEHEVAKALYRNGPASGSAHATLELENSRLKYALEGRALIEQAKGMIIAGQGGTEQEAFAVLTRISRREDRSLRETAAGVIENGAKAAHERNARVAKELLAQGSAQPGRGTAHGGPDSPAGAAGGAAGAAAATEPVPPTEKPSAATSSAPAAVIDQLASENSQDPVRRRWRPATPSHASGRRNAPKFRSSTL